jgi:hypothetical protein
MSRCIIRIIPYYFMKQTTQVYIIIAIVAVLAIIIRTSTDSGNTVSSFLAYLKRSVSVQNSEHPTVHPVVP